MSDPIRSISQNNFILADQKVVSHDNTLRGNGTEESPIGLNETVLWDGNGTSSTSVSLSESISNFERVRVTYVNNNYVITTEAGINGNMLYFGGVVFGWNTGDLNRLQIFGGNYTISNNGTTLTAAGGNQVYFSNTGNSYGGQASKNIPLLKVVGINRIANN